MSKTINDLAADLIEAMPTPTTPPPIPALDLDDKGKPQLNAAGKLKRKRGRPSKVRTAPPPPPRPAVDPLIFDREEPPAGSTSSPPADTADTAGQTAAAAVTCALAWESVGMMILGEAGRFESDAERQHITDSLAAYLAAKGLHDIPPGVALAIAATGYVGARLHRPTVTQRLAAIVAWGRRKLGI